MKFSKNKLAKKNNKTIYSIEFTNDNGFKFNFINLGCYIKNVIIPYSKKNDKFEDVVLGYNNLKNIINDKSYFNCIVGRVAGRISNSSFFLNNKKYNLFNNEKKHHLHGGKYGFNRKIWNIKDIENNNNSIVCSMNYKSLHLEEGYPGNLECYVKYSLNNKNQITIEFQAISDKDTLVNLTNHNYWNFNGHTLNYNNIENHILSINSNKYCEVDNELIPNGKIISTAKTKYNFHNQKKIGLNTLKKGGIDNYYIFRNYKKTVNKVLKVFSPSTGMGMILLSDQPGLQFYTGNNLNCDYIGKNNRYYGKNFGLCFEPQLYPNAINIRNFPSIVLKKGNTYKSKVVFNLINNFNDK